MSKIKATSTRDPSPTSGRVQHKLVDPQAAFPQSIDVSTARMSVAPYSVNRGVLQTEWSVALVPSAGLVSYNELPSDFCALGNATTAVFAAGDAPQDSSVWHTCEIGMHGTLTVTAGYIEEVVYDLVLDDADFMYPAAVLSQSFEAVGGLTPYEDQGVHVGLVGRFGTDNPEGRLITIPVQDVGNIILEVLSNKAMLMFDYLDGSPSVVRVLSLPFMPRFTHFIGLSVDHWRAVMAVRTGDKTLTTSEYPFQPDLVYPSGFTIGGEGAPRFIAAAVVAGPAIFLNRSFDMVSGVLR